MRITVIPFAFTFAVGFAGPVHAQMSLGLGAAYAPQFEGSADYRIIPTPSFSFKSDSFSVRSNGPGLEADFVRSRGVDAGPILRYNFGRIGSDIDNAQVSALPDIDGGLELGGYVQLNYPLGDRSTFISPRLSVVQGVSGGATGTVVEGSVGLTHLQGDWTFGGRFAATYANDDYMNTYFSVVGGGTSGLPAFNAGGGIKDVGISAFASYKFNDNLSATGILGYKVLTGDAASSPIVSIAGDKNQAFVGIGLSYTFN